MARLQPRPRLWEPGRQFPGFSSQQPGAVETSQAMGRAHGAQAFLLLHKRRGSFLFFSGLYLHFPNQKCPNQTGQVATGNHSSKVVFCFFHFFLKPHVEGKLTNVSWLLYTQS